MDTGTRCMFAFGLRYARNITKSSHVAPLQRYICRKLRFCWSVGFHPAIPSLPPSPSSDPIWSENILAACWLETACGLGIWISAGAGGSISSAPHSCRIFEPILWLHLHTDYGKLLGQNIRATRSQCSSRILVSPTRCPFRSLWSLALALLVRQQRFGFRQLFSVFHCASVSLLFLFCCFLWATATSEWAMNISGI